MGVRKVAATLWQDASSLSRNGVGQDSGSRSGGEKEVFSGMADGTSRWIVAEERLMSGSRF